MRDRVREVLAKARRDTLVFTATVVLLTPFVLCATALMALGVGMYLAGGVPEGLLRTGSLPGAARAGCVMLAVVLATSVAGSSHRARPPLVALLPPLGVLAGLTGFSLAVPVEGAGPWLAWGGGAFLFLALLGRSYTPRSDYDFGGPLGSFGVRDDLDRGHALVGCLLTLPSFLVDAYAAAFGGAALWRTLSPLEEATAVEVLQALLADDERRATRALDRAGPAARVVLGTLLAADLVAYRRGGAGLLLTLTGRRALTGR